MVTASADGTARLWNAITGQECAVLHGFVGPVNAVAFSPDGTLVVTASSDGTARLWDVATRQERAILHGHGGPVNAVAFSPDGVLVVTASADGTARLWDVTFSPERVQPSRGFKTIQELINYANSIVYRRLTKEQRQQFFLQ